MDETEKYQQRLQAIAEKRRLQEEQDRAKREMEDERLRLQQLKRKSLRDQWLMEGPPLSPTSLDGQSPRSPLWGSQAQEIEKHIDNLQTESQRLAEEEEKLKEQMEDGQTEAAKVTGAAAAETNEDEVQRSHSPLLDGTAAALTNGGGEAEAEVSHDSLEDDARSSTNGPIGAPGGSTTFPGYSEVEPGLVPNVKVNEEEEGTLVMRAERVIITDEGDDIPEDLTLQEEQKEAGQPEGTKKAEQSEGTKEAGQSEGAKEAGQSEGTKEAGQSEGTKEAGQSEGTKEAGQSEGTKDAEQSESTKEAEQSEGTKEAGKSQGTKEAEQSEGTKEAGKSQGTKEAEQSEGTKEAEQSEGTKEAGQSEGTPQPNSEAHKEGGETVEDVVKAEAAPEPSMEPEVEMVNSEAISLTAEADKATGDGDMEEDVKTNTNGDGETKAEGEEDRSEAPVSVQLQSPNDAVDATTVASVPVYSEAQPSSLSSRAENEEEAAAAPADVAPEEAETALIAQVPANGPGQFQDVSLVDPQENQRAEAGPGEQEPLLSQAKDPQTQAEPVAGSSPASTETHAPARANQGGEAAAPKRKTCQCCSVM